MHIFHKDQVTGLWLVRNWPEIKYKIHRSYRNARNTVLAPFKFLQNIWRFRKELWRFRTFDYKFNTDLFKRSLELTADFMESEDALSANAKTDAKEIRKFIYYLNTYSNPYTEAEQTLGVDYMELYHKVMGEDLCSWNYLWMNRPKEEWTPDQLKFHELQQLIHKFEQRSWKNAWKLIGRRGRNWWD